MSERDSDKKPEANQAHTHHFSPSFSAAFLQFLLISHVTHVLYLFLVFLPPPVSLQVFLSRRSVWQSLSSSGSEWVSEREWVSWMTLKGQMSTLPTKTCCSWEPSQQHPPLWSPSLLSLSALAAKGKGTIMWLEMWKKNSGGGRTEIKKENSQGFIISSASFPCRPRSLSSSTPSFMCLYFFWTLLLPPFSSLHPSSPSLLSPALSGVAVMNVNGCKCQIRWNDAYRTLRRQARVRGASRHPS